MTNAAKVFVDQGLHPGVRGSSDLQGHFSRHQGVRRSVGRVRRLLIIKDLTLVVKDLSLVVKDPVMMSSRQCFRRSVGRVCCLLVTKDLTLVVTDLSLVVSWSRTQC